jgi:hypothetical protein
MKRHAKPSEQVPLCNQVLLVERLMAELAMGALRLKGFSRKRLLPCKGWRVWRNPMHASLVGSEGYIQLNREIRSY